MKNILKAVLFALIVTLTSGAYCQRGPARADVVNCVKNMIENMSNARNILFSYKFSEEEEDALLDFANSLSLYSRRGGGRGGMYDSLESVVMSFYYDTTEEDILVHALEELIFKKEEVAA